MHGYQQFKNIFAKGSTPNQAEVFANKKVKNAVPKIYVLKDFDGEDILECIMTKNCKRYIKQSSKEEMGIDYMLNGNVMIMHLIARWTKKILLHKMSYYLQ